MPENDKSLWENADQSEAEKNGVHQSVNGQFTLK